MSGTLEDKVIRLIIARDASLSAKRAHQKLAAELGRCDGVNYEEGPCYRNPKREQCDICSAKQPAWELRQKTAYEAGLALRSLLRAGKSLIIDKTLTND